MRGLFLSVALLGLIAPAFAQQPPPASPPTVAAYQGNELVRVQTPSGSAGQLSSNHLRNTVGYMVVPGGATVVSSPGWFSSRILATGAITAWTVNLPNPAPDGMLVDVVNTTAAAQTNVTVQTAAGSQTQSLALPYSGQSLSAVTSAEWIFVLNSPSSTTGVWYRAQ